MGRGPGQRPPEVLLTYRVVLEIGLLLVEDKDEEEGNRYKKKREEMVRRVSPKFGTLNVGSIIGKSREIAEMMYRKKVDILCRQETRWAPRPETLEEATNYFTMV